MIDMKQHPPTIETLREHRAHNMFENMSVERRNEIGQESIWLLFEKKASRSSAMANPWTTLRTWCMKKYDC